MEDEDKFKGLLYSPEVLGGIGLLTAGLSGSAPSAALPSLLQGMQTASLFRKQEDEDEKQRLIKEYADQVPADQKNAFLIAPGKWLEKNVFNKNKDRKIIKDASGFQRYADTKERVFPDVVKEAKETKANYVNFKKGSEVISLDLSLPSDLVESRKLTKQGWTKFSQGVTSTSVDGLSKGAGTEVDKSIVSGELLLGELEYTKNVFRDEFATIPGQLKYKGLKALERTAPSKLTQENKQYIASYSRWEQASLQYFNQYRKLITGVAAGEKEIGWLESSIPSAKDSPSIYKAKINNQIAIQKRVIENARKFKKFGTGQLYSVGKDADGNEVKQYSEEFLQYMRDNKIAPTGAEIDNLVKSYKIDYGDSWEQIKPELNKMYAGIEWEDIYEKYINLK